MGARSDAFRALCKARGARSDTLLFSAQLVVFQPFAHIPSVLLLLLPPGLLLARRGAAQTNQMRATPPLTHVTVCLNGTTLEHRGEAELLSSAVVALHGRLIPRPLLRKGEGEPRRRAKKAGWQVVERTPSPFSEKGPGDVACVEGDNART